MTQKIFQDLNALTSTLLQNVVTYNKSEYFFCVCLINGEGPILNLTTNAVIGLSINDNITQYTHSGELVIRNDNDIIERSYMTPGETYSTRQQDINQSNLEFFFRGDGRDIVLVYITPRNTDNINQETQPSANDAFTLRFLFSVVQIYDEIISDGSKVKRLVLKDLDHQLLEEINLGFSTSSYVSDTNVSSLDNSERAIKTGEVIRQVLIQTLTDGSNSSNNTQIGIATGDAWDEGASDLFYSSPSEYNAIDDIDYILQRHVSSVNYDACVLRKERNNTWSLMGLSTYFKNAYDKTQDGAGALHIEKFFIQSIGDTVNVVLKKERTPTGLINNTGYLNSSYISSYKLHNTDADEIQRDVVTHAVHSYQLADKQFNIDLTRNNIDAIKKSFSGFYVDPMKGDNQKPSPNFYLSQTRIQNKNLKNVFSLTDTSEDVRLNWGRNQVLQNMIYKNLTIEFEVDGISNRQAGRFISIDRTDSLPSSKHDDRLLGIWFIVNVEHMFTQSTYRDKIIAVKTYSFTKVGGNSDID